MSINFNPAISGAKQTSEVTPQASHAASLTSSALTFLGMISPLSVLSSVGTALSGRMRQLFPQAAAVSAASADLTHFDQIYDKFLLTAEAARLAYVLDRSAKVVNISSRDFDVSFISRSSGLMVRGNSAISFDNTLGQVIFAIPGTDTANDWVSNFCATQTVLSTSRVFCRNADFPVLSSEFNCLIHSGFLTIAESIIENFESKNPFAGKREIYFTGHSQGGAVASILAYYAATHKRFLGIPEDCTITCITFASPRVFNDTAVSFYQKIVSQSFRIYNPCDSVPRIPLGSQGFKHAGHPICLSSSWLAQSVIQDVKEELTSSVHGDVDATCKVAATTLSLFNPKSWISYCTVPHSMDHHQTILAAPAAKAHILRLLDYRALGLFPGNEVRYTPSLDDEDQETLEIALPN